MNTTSPYNKPIDLIARCLAKLAIPELTLDTAMIPLGHKMRNALLKAGESGDWLPENELWHYAAGHLVRLGFLEREAERRGLYYWYRITREGQRFAGCRSASITECPKWWVRVVKSAADDGLCFDLTNLEHVMLMFKLIDRGYLLAGSSVVPMVVNIISDDDTEPLAGGRDV